MDLKGILSYALFNFIVGEFRLITRPCILMKVTRCPSTCLITNNNPYTFSFNCVITDESGSLQECLRLDSWRRSRCRPAERDLRGGLQRPAERDALEREHREDVALRQRQSVRVRRERGPRSLSPHTRCSRHPMRRYSLVYLLLK